MATVLLDAGDMRRTLGRMAHEILEAHGGAQDLVVVGIMRRGWPIAKRLAFLMTQIEGSTVPCGKLDPRGHRDDKGSRKAPDSPPPAPSPFAGTNHPENGEGEAESEIPFEVNEKKIILVDEVIYTGRTIRAALDALVQLGRPASIQLAVLIDRGHRELPIQPDYCGKTVQTTREDHVIVRVNEYDGEDVVVLDKMGEGVPA